ncbi:MAG: phosphodiester glycosidase family protein [Rhizobiaceae bacterium]|nr:phosphodiester glycosidase family protein [Rhizobiaceae bacterium]
MTRTTLLLLIVLIALVAASWLAFRLIAERKKSAANLPLPCVERDFEEALFVVCTVDTSQYSVRLALKGADGKPYERFDRLAHPYVFAMNAGMYHADFSPVGLYVEDGIELSPLNLNDGDGNFFMKPNGVFYIDQHGRAGVLESTDYARANIEPSFATQSGPMLVINGALHERFEPDGKSRYIRNGVGVDKEGRAVLAISRKPVSLGRFARLFRDELSCPNALFLDGAISALYDGRRYVVGGKYPAGPMLVVRKREDQ